VQTLVEAKNRELKRIDLKSLQGPMGKLHIGSMKFEH